MTPDVSYTARRVAPRALRPIAGACLMALLAACQTTHVGSSGGAGTRNGGGNGGDAPGNVSRLPPGNPQRDGPQENPPPDLEAVPDAVPQLEALRPGGPNKPYEVAGHTYVPLTDGRAVTEKGLASWYGKKFHGRRTASGEAYNMYAMTAAHKTLPIPSYARVRNPANGREVVVRVNDRGPFAPGRAIDLSYTAALKLGVLGGVQPVEITRITDDDIRSGAALDRGTRVAGATPAGTTPSGNGKLDGAGTKATSMTVGDLDRVEAAPRPASGPGLWARLWHGKPPPPDAASSAASAGTGTGTVVAAAGSSMPAGGDRTTPGFRSDTPVSSADSARARSGALSAPASAATPLPPADAASSTDKARVAPLLPGLDLRTGAANDIAVAPLGSSATTGNDAASSASSRATSTDDASTPASSGKFTLRTENDADASVPAGVVLPPLPAASTTSRKSGAGSSGTARATPTAPAVAATVATTPVTVPSRPDPRDEHTHADTAAGIGYWLQIGAFRQRDGALDFQHRLIDEQPWLAPLLAVFIDHGLNKLQAGPYPTREEARNAAEHVRSTLQLVPTIVEKH